MIGSIITEAVTVCKAGDSAIATVGLPDLPIRAISRIRPEKIEPTISPAQSQCDRHSKGIPVVEAAVDFRESDAFADTNSGCSDASTSINPVNTALCSRHQRSEERTVLGNINRT